MMLKPDTKPRRANARALPQTLPAAPGAAALQAQTLGTLVQQAAARSTANGMASAALLPLAGRVDTWTQLFALQAATWQRHQQLQQGWLDAWAGWLQEFADLKRANTLSEHVEQQYNLAAQAGSLLKDQAADLLNLQENVQVDYGYWVAQKVRQVDSPAG